MAELTREECEAVRARWNGPMTDDDASMESVLTVMDLLVTVDALRAQLAERDERIAVLEERVQDERGLCEKHATATLPIEGGCWQCEHDGVVTNLNRFIDSTARAEERVRVLEGQLAERDAALREAVCAAESLASWDWSHLLVDDRNADDVREGVRQLAAFLARHGGAK